jgi:ADP-ribose pyrophosphatase
MAYKITASNRIFEHKRLNLIEDDILLPDGTPSKYLKFEYTHNSAAVLAKNQKGEYLLIKEYSHAPRQDLLTIPGGLIDLDEDIQAGARREFQEETGYTLKNLQYLGMTYPYHRRSPEKLHLFFGEIDEFVGHEREKAEEGIEVIWKTEEEIRQAIAYNQILNSHGTAHWIQYQEFIHSRNREESLPIAAAINLTDDEGKFLLKKRGKLAGDSVGKWENTGGKIEEGEDIVDGIKREVKEEIGVGVDVTSQVKVQVTKNPAGETYLVYLFDGKINSGTPKIFEPEKCSEIGWFASYQIEKLDLADYTREDFQFINLLD